MWRRIAAEHGHGCCLSTADQAPGLLCCQPNSLPLCCHKPTLCLALQVQDAQPQQISLQIPLSSQKRVSQPCQGPEGGLPHEGR